MYIDHIDITLPTGTLSDGFCEDLNKLLTEILGWPGETRHLTSPLDGSARTERVYFVETAPPGFGPARREQFVVLREAGDYLRPGFEDHIGVRVEPAELDRIFAQCQQLAATDRRVELGWMVNGQPLAADVGTMVIRGFFVRFLLPLWLDIQTRDRPSYPTSFRPATTTLSR